MPSKIAPRTIRVDGSKIFSIYTVLHTHTVRTTYVSVYNIYTYTRYICCIYIRWSKALRRFFLNKSFWLVTELWNFTESSSDPEKYRVNCVLRDHLHVDICILIIAVSNLPFSRFIYCTCIKNFYLVIYLGNDP